MKKKRFFTLLHCARILTSDKQTKRLILKAVHYGYTLGWNENQSGSDANGA